MTTRSSVGKAQAAINPDWNRLIQEEIFAQKASTMYGAVGASISVREQRKKSISLKPAGPVLFPKKLPNGKNAWGKHGAGKLKAAENQKRRVNKNKIGDSGAEASLEKSPDGHYRQTGVVNIVLYVGFGLVTLGLIITFVGIGEHGFKSPELQLIGPSLIGCGVLFCLLRLFFCSVPTCCSMCGGKKQLDEKALLSPSRETLADDSTEDQNIPRPLATEEEKDPEDNEQNAASQSAHTIRSTIPNYIEDEGDDDHSLGLHVEYIDEASKQSTGGSRPASSQSRISLASKASKLPDVHSNASRSNSELVLNPATLQSAGD
ncbi:uncharacterized protein [Palaemon carinicauda]|uniref:uncharacterized protein isoform X4 n=1 Tax=Palaemon carinicauda TaxID=392227 RepID=UPI0035B57886